MTDVFRIYLIIVASVLLAAGVTLACLTWILKRDVSKVWTIYRGWLVMVPIVLGCIYAGREATIGLVTLLSLGGFYEFARATGLDDDRWMTGSVLLAILATGLASFVPDPFTETPGWFGLFQAMPVFAILVFLAIPILLNRSKGQLQSVSLGIVGYIYMGWMFGHLGFLANSQHAQGYLLYLIFAVEVNDVAAFVCGKLFGRRPLRSNISPNKTWEGALGALAVSLAMPWVLGFSFPEEFGVTQRILTGLIVGVGGQLGDLAISFIKRDLGVKDMGTAIPGHGGVLDRIDSLIFTAPLFLHMVNYYYGI